MRFAALSRSLLAASAITLTACASHPQPPAESLAPSSNPVIVRLVGRHETITITTGPVSPLYTIADSTGHVMVADITLTDLKKTRPDLYNQLAPALAPQSVVWAGAESWAGSD